MFVAWSFPRFTGGSDARGRAFGDGQQTVGFVVAREFLGLRIPFERALELFGNTTEQEGAGGPVRDGGVANRRLPRANAIEKIAGMALAAIEVGFLGAQWFERDGRRVGHQGGPVPGNSAMGPDHADGPGSG